MTFNLLSKAWSNLDSFELRLLLDKRIEHLGQLGEAPTNKLYLPCAGSSCRIVLLYRDKKIVAIEPGPAFDATEWRRISEEVDQSILTGPLKIGREWSFSTFRVLGSWQGDRSRVRILPPPDEAPRAPVEMADHPFILEFPIKASDFWPVTNHRRLREHRKLTLLLNVLLAGRTSFQSRRFDHCWAVLSRDNSSFETIWVQQSFFGKLGGAVIDELSPPAGEQLEKVAPDEYYTKVERGRGLRVPTDLDESICCYMALSAGNRAKFDRAIFWVDMASRQWNLSVSASFGALVSAIESLTERGDTHGFTCPCCGKLTQHEVPGATRRFKDFLDIYAPGTTLAKRRDNMYSLRSGILHGSDLMQLDQDLAFGVDPPWWNERELHAELWGVTRIALRNWLKNPPAT
jgi:hypothetical protein